VNPEHSPNSNSYIYFQVMSPAAAPQQLITTSIVFLQHSQPVTININNKLRFCSLSLHQEIQIPRHLTIQRARQNDPSCLLHQLRMQLDSQ